MFFSKKNQKFCPNFGRFARIFSRLGGGRPPSPLGKYAYAEIYVRIGFNPDFPIDSINVQGAYRLCNIWLRGNSESLLKSVLVASKEI